MLACRSEQLVSCNVAEKDSHTFAKSHLKVLLVGHTTGLLSEITSATGRHNIGVREEEQWMTVPVNTYMVSI